MNSDNISAELAQIRHRLDGLLERGRDRLVIMPEDAVPHVVLWQSYPIEEVARIAATCCGDTHEKRIIEALKLLEAAERITNPDLWENQHLQREGSGGGDLQDEGDSGRELWALAEKLVEEAIAKSGKVPLKDLLERCYAWAGRQVTADARNKAFHSWAIHAVQIEHWQNFSNDNPAELTPEGFNKWERKYKTRKPDTKAFLARFGLSGQKGKAGFFASARNAVEALAGGNGAYTPFLKWLTESRRESPRQEKKTKQFVGKDNKNKRTRGT